MTKGNGYSFLAKHCLPAMSGCFCSGSRQGKLFFQIVYRVYVYFFPIPDVLVVDPISIESDYTGAKFYYQMPFISSSELCSRI